MLVLVGQPLRVGVLVQGLGESLSGRKTQWVEGGLMTVGQLMGWDGRNGRHMRILFTLSKLHAC